MELEIEYQDYILSLADDDTYTYYSKDNKTIYDYEYFDQLNPQCRFNSKCGIRVEANDMWSKSAILLSIGFSRLHLKSFIVSNGLISFAVGKTVFNLSLPSLRLNWLTECDDSTCFQIYEFQKAYIVHGELEITFIRGDGTIGWQFSGGTFLLRLMMRMFLK